MAQVTFNVVVLSVSQPTFTKTAKGGYNQIEIAFKKDGKVEGKKLIDFKYPEVYKFFLTLKGGETVQINSEKNEGEKYWNWTSTNLAGEPQASPAGTASDTSVSNSGPVSEPQSRATSAPRARVTGSNYETPAERARRQVYIVRQSSLSAAIETLKANTTPAKTGDGVFYLPITKEAVIALARDFEAYVFEPKVVGKFDDMDDDIPF